MSVDTPPSASPDSAPPSPSPGTAHLTPTRRDVEVDLPETTTYRLKNRFLGPPLHTEELAHERLGKPTALAVFASDNLSSSAYATEEILRVLIVAVGAAAFGLVVPLTLAMLVVLGVLILSYRQTIKAYPSAGGAYIVTRDNFGLMPAQVAGVALLTDYILTVAVSVAAGTAALVSAAPSLGPWTVEISVGFILLITFGNLRGVKESGKLFGVPTYFFILMMGVLITTGVYKMATGSLPQVTQYGPGVVPFGTDAVVMSVAIISLLLHAFASGGAAVTGVEAISNGVPAFKPPEWKNARETLVVMGTALGVMFLGLSILAAHLHVAPYIEGFPTVISQIGVLTFGDTGFGNVMHLLLDGATMMILVLADNTSFADFPRLASFHAGDNFMPRQLTKRGHRLVFSNGIIALAVSAIVLVIVTGAKVDKLIPLYAIGVFTSFTLSQAGMARHHTRLKEQGWRVGLAINATGAVMTAVITVVIGTTKFMHGAWVIIILVPVMVLLLMRLNKQYESEIEELAEDAPKAAEAPIMRRHVVLVFVENLDMASARAIQYARTLMPDELRAVHFDLDPIRTEDLTDAWREMGLGRLSLDIVEVPDRRIEATAAEIVARELVAGDTEVTVLLPRREYTRRWHRLLHDRTADKLAATLATLPHCNVTVVPYHLGTSGGAKLVTPIAKTKAKTRSKAKGKAPGSAPRPTELSDDDRLADGQVPIAGTGHRDRVTIAGRVQAMRVQPRSGVATLECTVADATGTMTVVFLGRRELPGLHTGRNIVATGVVGDHHGRLAMLNPSIELLSELEHELPPTGH